MITGIIIKITELTVLSVLIIYEHVIRSYFHASLELWWSNTESKKTTNRQTKRRN